ncbi:hypothetical protein BDB01DRAFT_835572 [Pilobolus umbonatus]|nr:hypothetical protein BDB01DRAFT_835572 [Pilobolus umbonatus]
MEKVTDSLENLALKTEQKPKASAGYDMEAAKKRRQILGAEPEQAILSLIRKACMSIFARPDFFKTLQTIKASFVQRDYEGIFTEPSNLEVYAAAYVPGRALCYYEIFSKRPQILKFLLKKSQIYCVGAGCGSELVAMAAAMTRLPAEKQQIKLILQDIGNYSTVIDSFERTIRDKWLITESQLECVFDQSDILDLSNEETIRRFSTSNLITFMFVMNELFVKKGPAMALIQKMIGCMRKNAYLLVVESAGSFSHLKVGNKTYMVYTLLDAIKDLELVVGEDARWYRHPEDLKYPLDVQNMRYFIRLYKKK